MAYSSPIDNADNGRTGDSSYPDPDNIPHFPWASLHLSQASQDDLDTADCTMVPWFREQSLATSVGQKSGLQEAQIVEDSLSETLQDMDFDHEGYSTKSDESMSIADFENDLPKASHKHLSTSQDNRKRSRVDQRRHRRRVRGEDRSERDEVQDRVSEEPARRSTRGVKKGLRKPVEPSAEFKAMHSTATEAFIDGDFDKAEGLINQAIRINPEIFTAHSLLSEIHLARGDSDRSLQALFHGAHTRPRDIGIWLKLEKLIMDRAGDGQAPSIRKSSIREAIYCLNRIIEADPTHIEARLRRADLNRELGKATKAACDYTRLLKQLPHNTDILRSLAEICIETNQSERAIELYENSIAHFQSVQPQGSSIFGWSDTNIYAELFLLSASPAKGLARVKSVSRWLQGREPETLWDFVQGDDREFDLENEPRRVELSDFKSNSYPLSTYGESLPLELRVKLGIFRLLQGDHHFQEAMRHFEWLEPDIACASGNDQHFTDLFREVADALRLSRRFEEALRFYGAIQHTEGSAGTFCYVGMVVCFRQIGMLAQAEEYYRIIKASNEGNIAAHKDMEAMFSAAETSCRGTKYQEELASHRRKNYRTFGEVENEGAALALSGADMPIDSIEPDENIDTPFLLDLMTTARKQTRGKKKADQYIREDLRPRFHKISELRLQTRGGSHTSRDEWMVIAEQTLALFKEMRVFFPLDRQTRFFGYSKESKARAMQTRTKQIEEEPSTGDQLKGVLALTEDVPTTFCHVSFDDWLELFLEHAIFLAEEGKVREAYSIVKVAISSNIWYHCTMSSFLIHVVWAICALIANDDESLCSISRFFMREYQFVTDSYRLYSALHRHCYRPHLWYNSGASQKYILRQVKAIDFSLIGEDRALALYNERASFTTRDQQGNAVRADSMDIALLMLYGQILYAGGSYAYALNYFYRAYSLDPTHPLINLSIALGYIHHALKRQSDNRHALIMQGLSFLFAYHDSRITSDLLSERQEATYNVGRMFHMIGLAHLAVKYYERCLEYSVEMEQQLVDNQCFQNREDFAPEAAYALQGLWAAAGNVGIAEGIVDRWMVLA